ncbi:helix-turn-helix domain-containing protein [Novosphingobium sp.]|uniref:helix-turn-helix domain-containing protein n=1 Tax=Novosphingobium sp. TaxID=1874826 RepID=UPI003D0CC94C
MHRANAARGPHGSGWSSGILWYPGGRCNPCRARTPDGRPGKISRCEMIAPGHLLHRICARQVSSAVRQGRPWRMALAKRLLRTREIAIEHIAARVGYGSASTFSTAFARHVGMPPLRYARVMELP